MRVCVRASLHARDVCVDTIVVEQLNKYFDVATPSFTIKRSSGNSIKDQGSCLMIVYRETWSSNIEVFV